MSRFIVWSDLHLNLWNYGADIVDGRNTRLADQAMVISQLDAYARDNDIENIFFCGDFFHKHSKIDSEVLKVAYESLELLKKERNRNLLFVVGNHDMATRDGSIHSLDMLRNYGLVVDKPYTLKFAGGMVVHAHPYTESKEDLARFLRKSPPNSVVLMHQGVSGIPVNSKGFTLNETLSLDMIPPTVLAFSGHYHSPCKVSDNLIIPGSPMQLNWSDRDEPRGWLDVTISEGEEPKINLISSIAPRFVEINSKEIRPEIVDNNFVRVLATEGEDVGEIRKAVLSKGARSVEVLVEKPEEKIDLSTSHFDTIEGLFEEYVKTKGLDEDVIKVGREIMEGTWCASIES